MPRNGISSIDTPTKARIRGAAEFMDAMGIPYFHTDLFNFNNVSKQAGWDILKEEDKCEYFGTMKGRSMHVISTCT